LDTDTGKTNPVGNKIAVWLNRCGLIHRRWLQQPHCQVTHGRNCQSRLF